MTFDKKTDKISKCKEKHFIKNYTEVSSQQDEFIAGPFAKESLTNTWDDPRNGKAGTCHQCQIEYVVID